MEASPMFFPGQTVTLQTHTPERTLTLTIDRPFAPFTKAVVLLARCPELSPDPVVVKIYDPRFLDERLPDSHTCPARPWSLEAERGADAIWDGPFHELDLYENYPYNAKGKATLAALWEKHFRILSTGCFKDEREVYDRLRPLQGTAIPRLLLAGTVVPPDERAIQPQAIVMEYIADAVSLCDVPPELVTPELCTSLLRTVDSFAGRGVVHADVNWNNVLFTPRERPTRVVVIDFGCGGVRTDDQDDEAWRACVDWNDDGRRARRVLRERGIDVPDV
uniref:non-specific serine/threonine protein kinase n=1 Tax=Ganoderma boninense TaxID=34458 RepID=A0A5K1JV79_9APHY|nr:Autophagy-related protein 11 [Ganoderma boninense]